MVHEVEKRSHVPPPPAPSLVHCYPFQAGMVELCSIERVVWSAMAVATAIVAATPWSVLFVRCSLGPSAAGTLYFGCRGQSNVCGCLANQTSVVAWRFAHCCGQQASKWFGLLSVGGSLKPRTVVAFPQISPRVSGRVESGKLLLGFFLITAKGWPPHVVIFQLVGCFAACVRLTVTKPPSAESYKGTYVVFS